MTFSFTHRISIATVAALLSVVLNAQLVSGPMPGFTDLRETHIWFQFAGNQTETIVYWPEANPRQKKSIQLVPDCTYGCVATAVISGLEPATTYRYHLRRDAKSQWTFTTQTLWQYRTDPPPFRMAMGSCAYFNEEPYDRPGKPYGGDYQIYTSIAAKKPDLMLWLGDNVYFREVDWNSRAGMVHRYSHGRATPEVRQLLPVCSHYAIWDDHDFGPNDATGTFIHKETALDVFRKFWPNPATGIPQVNRGEGTTSRFSWNDIDVFLLDNRYHRTAPGLVDESPTILGEEQIEWLIRSLKESSAPFKLVAVGGQFLNTAVVFENYATVPEERQRILDLIDRNAITGVLFLTGDRHCTELSRLTLPGGAVVHDLTCSPLSSSAYDNTKEDNQLRVPGTLIAQRNFATIDFSGPRKERVALISVFDNQGKLLWEHKLETPPRVGRK